MKLDLGSFAFGTSIEDGGGTPSWGTSLGQKKPELKFTYPGYDNIIIGMLYKSIPVDKVFIPLGKGGRVCNSLEDEGIQLAALFDKVYINEIKINASYILVIYEDNSDSWKGRRTLKYNIKTEFRKTENEIYYNSDFINEATKALGISADASWIISDLFIENQDELHLIAGIVNPVSSEIFPNSEARKNAFKKAIATIYENNPQLANIATKDPLSHKSLHILTNCLNDTSEIPINFVHAIRTKPFLLLAGISGTGKSRVVKQMAFESCPDMADLRKDPTSPGNYCLIEVKPNWHDSTELLGYESKIGGDHYVLTPFVKFLAKALLYPEVPFFVCLDEMNLAPVEQYFAEFLSVLESRTKIDGHIVSEPLIKASIFANSKYANDLKHDIFNIGIRERQSDGVTLYDAELSEDEENVYQTLRDQGLRIPENVVIIGTVNMDETTHQFSRKVIDRAMTIEMNLPEGTDDEGNEINPFKAFFENSSELAYREDPTSPSLYLATETKASDVINKLSNFNLDQTEILKQNVANFLTGLNTQLDGTPFKVAYRVQNELLLYFYQIWLENKEADWEQILEISIDQILMMKVLPRIEGDEELLEKPLERLILFCEPYPNASKKLLEMQARLKQSRFTSFWP